MAELKTRLRASIAATESALAEMRASLAIVLVADPDPVVDPKPPTPAPPAPVPNPPPAPSPPAPAPEPPTVVGNIAKLVREPMKLDRVIFTYDQHWFGMYIRFQPLRVLKVAGERIRVRCFNFFDDGALQLFQRESYPLMAAVGDKNGNFGAPVEIGHLTPAGLKDAWMTADATKLPVGWLKLNFADLGPGECAPTFFFYNLPTGAAVADRHFIPVARGMYERAMASAEAHSRDHVWTLAPPDYAPRAVPIGKRTYLSPDPALARAGLHCEYLVPMRWGDVHRPNRNKDGIVSSHDNQNYTWSNLHAKLPTTALLDGPRGVGSLGYTTHLQLSTAVVDGVPRNNTYFCDPWRVGKIAEDGRITTLVGFRHKGMNGHFGDADIRFDGNVSAYSQLAKMNLDLVGDWSAIPEARRGFWELWGMAWDERSLILDQSRRIPSENNENPHSGSGPVMFVADSQHNRICKIQFSATQHGVPPVVTEFIAAQDPWDVVCENGELFVSERKSHRICAYDATNGRLLRVVVQGQARASINDQIRRMTRAFPGPAGIEDCRAQPCVAPEGLYLQDGWVYFASGAQAQVRRIRKDGTDLQVVRPVNYVEGLSEFVKLAVSDGTFGPRGTTFTWTWANNLFGGPEVVFPDGTKMKPWWNLQTGGTGWWRTTAGYNTCGAVGQGRLICANMVEGIYRITRSEAGDLPYSDLETDPSIKGLKEFKARSLNLLHGENGYGFYGLPLPWGDSANMDAFFTRLGHQRPS